MGALPVQDCIRLNVWSGPRNISTTLMYSFARRDDTKVVDEPFYAHYLDVTGVDHPGREEVLTSQSCKAEDVVSNVLRQKLPDNIRLFYLKQMAHHLEDLDMSIFSGMNHLILIRDPRRVVPSLASKLGKPTLRDTGFPKLAFLFSYFKEQGIPCAVVDSDRLLINPERGLEQLCDYLGLAFQKAMLSWPPGPRPEDGIWAKYWYHNIHKSSGFNALTAVQEPPEECATLVTECQPIYEKLLKEAMP